MLDFAAGAHCTYCSCLKGWLEVGKKDLEAELVLPRSVQVFVQDTPDKDKLLLQASLNFCLLICSMSHRHHQLLSAAYRGSGEATWSLTCLLKHSLSTSYTPCSVMEDQRRYSPDAGPGPSEQHLKGRTQETSSTISY